MAAGYHDILRRHLAPVAAGAAFSARDRQAGHVALDQQVTLELGDTDQNVQHQLAGGTARRHAIERLKPDASRLVRGPVRLWRDWTRCRISRPQTMLDWSCPSRTAPSNKLDCGA